MKFKVIEYIKKYMMVNEEYQYVEVEKYYSADSWDDLQTLLMTLIDFSDASIRFEVGKEAVDEQ